MQCREKFIKLFAILIIGLSLLSLSVTSISESVTPSKAQYVYDSSSFNNGHYLPPEIWQSSDNRISNPMDRIFQLIFILFFISPPLIVVLLFLIWCELRKRNENK